MKPFKILLFAILLGAIHFSGAYAAGNHPKPFVVPELKSWESGKGTFTPSTSGRIVLATEDAEVSRIAHQLAEDWQTMFGTTFDIHIGKASAGDILLAIRPDKNLKAEGYTMKITDRVQMTAPTVQGLYWATRTLLQMAEQTPEHTLAQGTIRDWPDYGIRGAMLDCARKYIPIAYLCDWVKTMSYYKMNTLQIHLNDNGFLPFFDGDWSKTYAAFRLECDTYPGLTAEDGFYTKQEFIELQKLAESCGVNIIPEIDVPAHSLAFTHYKPEIGSKEYGMDHLDLSNPATYEFLDGLFKEYLEGENPVFRGPIVSIGTDEYSNRDKAVVEQFRAFTDRYIRYVEQFGKRADVWGSLTHAAGETPIKSENVVMNAWSNWFAKPKDMVAQGFHLISIPDCYVYIVPAAGYYRDYLDTRWLYENWVPTMVAEDVFEPFDQDILGGMFAVWNDHCGNGISVADIHHRIYPAMQTMAVKMWRADAPTTSFDDFTASIRSLSEAPGVNRLGRLLTMPGLVYEAAEVKVGDRLPYEEIGYDYKITMEIEGVAETPGTELFRSQNAVFYLADPINGMLGFARDGYLFTFGRRIHAGEKITLGISGNNQSTTLYINGKPVEELSIRRLSYNEGKNNMALVRTLVFPLRQAGNFQSKITRLQVEQQ